MPAHSSSASRLDPRSPLVLDTRELGRRPGSMRKVSRIVPAPADLAVEVAAVPAGSSVALELRLEAVQEGVLVSGTAQALISAECARCLDPIRTELVVDLQELYVYPDRVYPDRVHSDRDTPAEEGNSRLAGDLIDFEPALRDAVVLALPLAPHCREECPGLCTECGVRLADEPGHGHETVDARWAALVGLLDESTPTDRTTIDADIRPVGDRQES